MVSLLDRVVEALLVCYGIRNKIMDGLLGQVAEALQVCCGILMARKQLIDCDILDRVAEALLVAYGTMMDGRKPVVD